MKHALRRIPLTHGLVIALAMVALAPAAHGQGITLKSPFEPGAPRPMPGRVIVKLAAGAGLDASRLRATRPQHGIYRSAPWISPALVDRSMRHDGVDGAAGARHGLDRLMLVEYSSLASPVEVAASLSAVDGVEYAEPVYARHLHHATNDPGAAQQWYLDVIGARDAWDESHADSTIVVAVVDAGIDPGHEDLAAALWRNVGEMGVVDGVDRSTNGIDDDGNGYVDDWQGWDFAGADGSSPDNDPDPARESHGTEMSGIIGAIGDNGRGTVGVAYGARLMSLKITNEPASSFEPADLFNTHEAILYAAKMGADVINCSWGDAGRMRSEQEVIDAAIDQYGAVIIASAGNLSNDALFYPASYDGVLSVGAVTNGDGKAGFSNYNYRVDISAPGTYIYAPNLSNQYAYGQGTSHAAAIVSGAAALVRRRYPQLDAAQVAELLRATSDDNGAMLGDYAGRLGAGRLNVFSAMFDGATMTSARLVGHRAIDAGGDGVVDAGESVSLELDVQNVLAAAPGVTVTVAAVSPAVVIEGGAVDLGAMASRQTATTPAGAFRLTVPADAAPNSTITLRVTVRTDLRANDEYVVLRVAPTFATTDLNRIDVTFNGSGSVAYHGTDRRLGDGFRVDGGRDMIYHGGLMIGTDAAHLSDVVRIGPLSQGTAGGLQTVEPYRVALVSGGTAERGTARFDDAHRDAAARVGVDVRMTTTEFTGEADRDYVLVVYSIRNTTASRLANLHAGLYLDWDLGMLGENDVAALDEASRLGYVTNASMPGMVIGASLVSGQPLAFNAVDNPAIGVSSSFTAEQKWGLLGNGIGTRTTEPTDIGMVIGAGPMTIDPGATAEVAIMLAAADDLDALRASASRAVARYTEMSSVDEEAAGAIALASSIAPNPTGGDAVLSIALPAAASVTVRVVDATGRGVLAPFTRRLDAGSHRIAIDASSLADGVYVYEVVAGDRIARGRFVRLGGASR